MRSLLRFVLRSFALLLLAVSLFAGGLAAYEEIGTGLQNHARQGKLRAHFDDDISLVSSTIVHESVNRLDVQSAQASRSALGDPIARLQVGRIGLDVIVVEGVRNSDLAQGPGHYPNSSLLGSPGVGAIAGHRTGWGSPFLHLDQLKQGDSLWIEVPGRQLEYRVTWELVVKPKDLWILQGDPASHATSKLVLTTCTPPFTSRQRLVVWADLVRSVATSESVSLSAIESRIDHGHTVHLIARATPQPGQVLQLQWFDSRHSAWLSAESRRAEPNGMAEFRYWKGLPGYLLFRIGAYRVGEAIAAYSAPARVEWT